MPGPGTARRAADPVVSIRRRADQVLWQVSEHYTRDDVETPVFEDAYCYVIPDGQVAAEFVSILEVRKCTANPASQQHTKRRRHG
jgi:hypothetical protein